MLSYSTSLNF